MKVRILFILLALVSLNCQTKKHPFDNPLDPDGENYRVPATPVLTFSDSVAVSDSTYTLTWTKADRALDYILDESLKTDFSSRTTARVSGTSAQFKHTVLKQSVKYYYRVKGRNGKYEGKWSDTVTITVSPNTYTLSGIVSGVDGVTVTLNGDASGAQTVSSGGRYSFSVNGGGNYTVAPTKTGYVFSPPNKTFSNVSVNKSQDFIGRTKLTFTISGTVTGADGVSVTLSGDASGTKTVNSGGSYSFTVGEGGSYTVTPSKAVYVFTPASRTFTNVSADQSQNFTAQAIVKMVSIPGGTFQMGDEVGDLPSDCRPIHTVTVSGFEMSVYEITNAQYAKYMNEALASGDVTATSSSVKGSKGAYSGQEYIYLSGYYSDYPDARCWIKYASGTFMVETGKENYPVVWVTWYGSKAFALYYGLDLPTEAEWEYSCRGGKQYKYGTDDGTLSTSKANYWDNGIHHPLDVGSYPNNPYGLYDMSGNVWEWCHDWYGTYPSGSVTNPTGALSGSYRVVCGGGWGSPAALCRSAGRVYYDPGHRDSTYPDYRYSSIGFRVVRRVSPQNY